MTHTVARNLNPTERAVMSAVTLPMGLKAVQGLVSSSVGRDVPNSTIQNALTNLSRWGMLSKTRAKTPRGNASRMVYRKASEARV